MAIESIASGEHPGPYVVSKKLLSMSGTVEWCSTSVD